ncbi:MAG: thioredoxin [Chlorobiales bacterium]|nr:thioredoxin [Chlorobiales bacterium]
MVKKSFDKLLRESEKPVFVDFWAAWCSPCSSVAPSIKRLAEEFAGKLTVVKINVDEQPEVAAKYQVQGIPALMLFDKGTIKWRTTGVLPYENIRAEVIKTLGW